MSKIGIILCARTGSQRFPNKILREVAGQSCYEHMLDRLKTSIYKTIVAVSATDKNKDLLIEKAKSKGIETFFDEKIDDEDVLGRIIACADHYGFEHIVRMTHDDIFVNVELMESLIEHHLHNEADHTECPLAPRGTDSEVIAIRALKLAAEHTKHLIRREHIRYYVKRKPFKFIEFPLEYRLALDYTDDFMLIEIIFKKLYCGKPIPIYEIEKFMLSKPHLLNINRLPKVSVYITNYNYGEYLDEAIQSVKNQTFKDWELIIIDDCSNDNSCHVLGKYAIDDKIKIFYNKENLGLTKSSNKAITEARGEYVLRLDADDWLEKNTLEVMCNYLEIHRNKGIVYSDYNEGDAKIDASLMKPPHPACALIRRNAWNDIRYNEAISCRDGLDFWLKFLARFEIGHISQALWNYRKHGDSLSVKKEALETERKILNDFVKEKEEELNV